MRVEGPEERPTASYALGCAGTPHYLIWKTVTFLLSSCYIIITEVERITVSIELHKGHR